MIGVMTGIWTIFNGLGNFCGGAIVDKVGRKLQMSKFKSYRSRFYWLTLDYLVCGYIGCTISLICITILIALFAGTDNKGGNRAAVFFIFLTLVWYEFPFGIKRIVS
jgi:MFS family permease